MSQWEASAQPLWTMFTASYIPLQNLLNSLRILLRVDVLFNTAKLFEETSGDGCFHHHGAAGVAHQVRRCGGSA